MTAASHPLSHLVTAEELLAMPHDEPCELIAGEIVMMTPTGGEHGEFSGNISVLVGSYAIKNGLGRVFTSEAGFLIARDPDTVRVPDVAFIRSERYQRTRRFIPGAPDLAVEVVSPSDPSEEVEAKAQAWLDAGSLLVWVVWPETRSVTVHRPGQPVRILHEKDTITGENVLPGFECRVGEFFSE